MYEKKAALWNWAKDKVPIRGRFVAMHGSTASLQCHNFQDGRGSTVGSRDSGPAYTTERDPVIKEKNKKIIYKTLKVEEAMRQLKYKTSQKPWEDDLHIFNPFWPLQHQRVK